MTNGFLRVGAATLLTKVADCEHNTNQIIELTVKAVHQDVSILVLPELSITGYTCGDLFMQKHLQDQVVEQLIRLKKETETLDITIIVGAPLAVGNALYNCAVVISQGAIIGITVKTHIPNYSEFYEKRWFEQGHNLSQNQYLIDSVHVPIGVNMLYQHRDFPEAIFGIEICEDLWVPNPPSGSMAVAGATLIFNPSASNDLVGKSEYRQSLISSQSAKTIAGYVYASSGYGESTTDLVFGGQCLIYENGTLLSKSTRFVMENQLVVSDIDLERLLSDRRKMGIYADGYQNDLLKYTVCPYHNSFKPLQVNRYVDPHPFVPTDPEKLHVRCEEIFNIQSIGLAKRLEHIGCQTVIIGVSGGLDSTLALLVCMHTFNLLNMDPKNIIAITMPGFGTTDRTYRNACDLILQLGCTLKEISIKEACLRHFLDIGHDPNIHDVTYENTQARERTQILMDYANKANGIVVGTGDLSELALGFATYNGDHMSMYAVNASIPKTLVRYLVNWVAHHKTPESAKNVLLDVLDTPVSPELLPPDTDGSISQKTEDLIGPYELHDFFLYYCVRFGFSPSKIYYLANMAFYELYTEATVKKWLIVFYKRFFSQQFKRSCMPDGPKVGSINLSPRGDWRMPSDGVVRSWLMEIESL
ncbi:MAG: NAD(+) synthase [Firmicutes bacterium HGW-Firmicutes-2]|jgi:NAD+ synthase (glutamine-hydrolysing)|nr:MAG: NAD(+) synthase [Firmicutes bacterium HGW-Firmicutes-2]